VTEVTTPQPDAPRPWHGRGTDDWERLAALGSDLARMTDETEILRVALDGALTFLRCESIELTLHPFAGRPALVAEVDHLVRDGEVRVRKADQRAPEPDADASARSLVVPLPGASTQVGLLRLAPHRLLGQAARQRRARAFALVLANSLTAVRALENERRVVEATYRTAMLDRLTSLGTRSLLFERGELSLTRARASGKTAALLLFDVDDFKRINDTLGHHAGDRVLAEFGRRLRRGVRDRDLAVRLGGDEFAVLTSQINGSEDAEGLADRLLAELAPPFVLDDIELYVRSSVGIAVFGEDGESVDELLRAADLAMYAAKGLGAGRWQRYNPSSEALAERWSTLDEDVRSGSLVDQLVLHYQPQVDVWSGEVVGFESLVRWEHRDLGLLAPQQFVPLAERAGLMSQLTHAVLDRALDDYAQLRESAPECSISVNISPRNLLGRGLVSDVRQLLAGHGVPAERLTLEVTEPAPGISPAVNETLSGLVELGCRVSVSEFGTGSSSLMALSRYEGIRELKLDSGLVADVLGEPASDRLTRAIIGTAHALGVRVVAEGVESRQIVAHLRDLGCDVLQGFYVRPPAVLDEIRHWAEQWPALREERLGLAVSERS
jgi:diguanylate cyclase (GGDEF)-like protein